MTTPLTEKDIVAQLAQVPSWRRSGKSIVLVKKFGTFLEAIAFVNHVAKLADPVDHHPDILIQYTRVTLTLSTHSAGGLTELDFSLAQKIGA